MSEKAKAKANVNVACDSLNVIRRFVHEKREGCIQIEKAVNLFKEKNLGYTKKNTKQKFARNLCEYLRGMILSSPKASSLDIVCLVVRQILSEKSGMPAMHLAAQLASSSCTDVDIYLYIMTKLLTVRASDSTRKESVTLDGYCLVLFANMLKALSRDGKVMDKVLKSQSSLFCVAFLGGRARKALRNALIASKTMRGPSKEAHIKGEISVCGQSLNQALSGLDGQLTAGAIPVAEAIARRHSQDSIIHRCSAADLLFHPGKLKSILLDLQKIASSPDAVPDAHAAAASAV